jgi:hypothetical protein
MEFSLFYDNTILNHDNSAAFLNCCESVSDDDRSPVKPLLCFFTFPSSTLFCRLLVSLRHIFSKSNNEIATAWNLIDLFLPKLYNFWWHYSHCEICKTKLATWIITPSIKKPVNINCCCKRFTSSSNWHILELEIDICFSKGWAWKSV